MKLHEKRLLKYMLTGKGVSAIEAIKYNCHRLPFFILDLKKLGYKIEEIKKPCGTGQTFSKYFICPKYLQSIN